MTERGHEFPASKSVDDFRLPQISAGFCHWFADTVMTDAPLGSIGMNAHLSRLEESVEDRRARSAIEGGICQRRAYVADLDLRHWRRAW